MGATVLQIENLHVAVPQLTGQLAPFDLQGYVWW